MPDADHFVYDEDGAVYQFNTGDQAKTPSKRSQWTLWQDENSSQPTSNPVFRPSATQPVPSQAHMRCRACGELCHFASECRKKFRCTLCKGVGHTKDYCNRRCRACQILHEHGKCEMNQEDMVGRTVIRSKSSGSSGPTTEYRTYKLESLPALNPIRVDPSSQTLQYVQLHMWALAKYPIIPIIQLCPFME